jgi:hypothetical protein
VEQYIIQEWYHSKLIILLIKEFYLKILQDIIPHKFPLDHYNKQKKIYLEITQPISMEITMDLIQKFYNS